MPSSGNVRVDGTPVAIMSGHQPHFLPALGYFAKMRVSDVFVYSDDVQYVRKEWQNRNRVWFYQHWQWLSAPVRPASPDSKRIVDMRFVGNEWRRDTVKRLTSLLRKAPNFAAIEPILSLVSNERYVWLADLNIEISEYICDLLGITAKRVRGTELNCNGTVTTKLRKQMVATGCQKYLSGPSGPSYMVSGVFSRDELLIYDWTPHEEKGWRSTVQIIAECARTEDVWKTGTESIIPWTHFVGEDQLVPLPYRAAQAG